MQPSKGTLNAVRHRDDILDGGVVSPFAETIGEYVKLNLVKDNARLPSLLKWPCISMSRMQSMLRNGQHIVWILIQ